MGAPFSVVRPRLAGEFGRLRRQMAGHAEVEPVLDSGGQIQQFDSHLSGLVEFLNVFPALSRLVALVIAISMTDFNIC
jgi:hypothetical protein